MADLRDARFPRHFGAYVLERRIAVGGMAEVLEARSRGPGGFEARVALKRLLPAYRDDGHLVRAFLREARLGALLRHRNLARVHEVGRVEGVWYFTLDLVEGADLHRLALRLRSSGVPFPAELAVYTVAEVCAGLHHAHRRRGPSGRPLRIVHRDVSPQNVLLGREGDVKLVDFGIARTALRRNRTDRGVVKGKVLYMSPEQARGERLDPRSDVYSAGVVLYELLAGAHPYAPARPHEVFDQLRAPRFAPPHARDGRVPRDLSAVVMRALAPERADRFASAGDLADALYEVLHRRAPAFSPRRAGALLTAAFDDLDTPVRDARASAVTASGHRSGAPPLPTPRGDDTPTESLAPALEADDDDETMILDTGLFDLLLHTATESAGPTAGPPRTHPPTGRHRRGALRRLLGR